MKTCLSRSPQETRDIARNLAPAFASGGVLLLHGNLGAGKTCFVEGLAAALGWEGTVTSPTYNLVHEYPTRPPLVHVDLYRLSTPEAIFALELESWLEGGCLLAVEWSERASGFWPSHARHIWIETDAAAPELRRLHIGEAGETRP